MVQASVCIASYKRPDGLNNLLLSLSAQKEPPTFEIIVVDNDRDGTAIPVVERFSNALPIRCLIEPDRGLSRVRNRAVLESRGDFIAFIDDDEVASPTWLATLDRVRSSTNAAAVFGPVCVTFEPAIPPEIRHCRLFSIPSLKEGDPLHWYQSRTSNAYVDRRALPAGEPPFRMLFDRTGGEDTDLFFRMARSGAKFAYGGPEALVTEFREKSRSDLAWVMRRSLRNGGNLAELYGRDESIQAKAHHATRAIGHSIKALAAALKVRRTDPHAYVDYLIEASKEAGRFLGFFGYCHREYVR